MDTRSPIEIAEHEIQRDKDDLKRLKKRYPGYDFVRVEIAKSNASINGKPVAYAELDISVCDVVNSEPDREWTSLAVFEEMRRRSLRLPEKDEAARNAVGYSLIALLNGRSIERTHEGRGRDPHRYRALPMEKEVAPEMGTTS